MQIQSTSISSTSFSLSWDPPLYDDQNGVISYYIILVTEFETDTVKQYTSYSTTLSLSLLHPSYTYHCAIAAYTVALGPYSIQFNVTTSEEGTFMYITCLFMTIFHIAPSQPPQNFFRQAITSTSVLLSWNPPPFESQNGHIIAYYLNITSLDSGDTVLYNSVATSVHISGLIPYTSYTCIVAAMTSVGLGPYTTTISFTTNEDGELFDSL